MGGKTVAPGPGAYDAKQNRTGKFDIAPAHGKAGKCLLTYNAEVPGHRVAEDPSTVKSRAIVPGPGSYDAKFDKMGKADVQPSNGKAGKCLLTYDSGPQVTELLKTLAPPNLEQLCQALALMMPSLTRPAIQMFSLQIGSMACVS